MSTTTELANVDAAIKLYLDTSFPDGASRAQELQTGAAFAFGSLYGLEVLRCLAGESKAERDVCIALFCQQMEGALRTRKAELRSLKP